MTIIVAALTGAADSPAAAGSAPALAIQPSTVLLGDAVAVSALGLAPGSQATVTASGVDAAGTVWQSSATFTVGATGTIDLRHQAPASGTYAEADAAGLFWSMRTDDGVIGSPYALLSSITLTLESAGQPAASAPVTFLTRQSLVSTDLAGEIVGHFHVPSEQTSRSPALVVLGGSEGGADSSWAALLASKLRVPVLALAYFGKPGLPPTLENIPLEYFQRAFTWLAAHPLVQRDRYILVGASRGAELALQCASLFPGQVRAVAAQAPSSVRWQGHGNGPPAPAWTWQGKALPYLAFHMSGQMHQSVGQAIQSGTPYRAAEIYEYSLQQTSPAELAAATIPIELAQGSVMVAGSGDDGVWPSSRFATEVASRSATRPFASPVVSAAYPLAGHVLRPPYLPTTANVMMSPPSPLRAALGGTAAENAAAAGNWWTLLVDFLQTAIANARS